VFGLKAERQRYVEYWGEEPFTPGSLVATLAHEEDCRS
jgi:hypothetical protein